MSMHVHILGIGGTFMGGVAAIAKAAGFKVTGSDLNVYPPMRHSASRHWASSVVQGYGAEQLDPAPRHRRGRQCPEPRQPGHRSHAGSAAWLTLPGRSGWRSRYCEEKHRDCSRRHPWQTTTTAMLTWILEEAGLEPGFSHRRRADQFRRHGPAGDRGGSSSSRRMNTTRRFSTSGRKFVHYRPRTAILNNLEYDHADIYADVAAIRWQFHQLIRTVPAAGRIVVNGHDAELSATLNLGCWTPRETFALATAVGRGGSGRGGWLWRRA